MTAALALPPCRQCALLAAAGEVPATCGDCGGYLTRAPLTVAWRPSRGVDGFLRDLHAIRQARLAQRGPRSGTGAALDAASSGVFGAGCRGTKGAGAPGVPDHRAPVALHPGEALYASLRGTTRIVAALVVDGAVAYSTTEAARLDGVALSIEQAIGFRLLTPDEQTRVRQKIATRDRRPALTRCELVGVGALDAAAREWA